ncbi:hypothetical protein I4U23_015473 [Adineta vaga]|nr:hypothetical protein I4U23_015473 [Adineta vaga]
MIAFGITACIFSIIVGYMAKFQCRSILFLIVSFMCYASFITMFLWKPNSSQMYVLYILVSLQGLASAVWNPVESALYESVFSKEKEAAYSCIWLAQNTGYLVVYLYASSIRVRTSIILQIVYLTIALIGYFILELHQYLNRRKQQMITLTKAADTESD